MRHGLKIKTQTYETKHNKGRQEELSMVPPGEVQTRDSLFSVGSFLCSFLMSLFLHPFPLVVKPYKGNSNELIYKEQGATGVTLKIILLICFGLLMLLEFKI